jgi:hypothetical protein
MFAKLLAIILAVGVIGCALLVNRQKRIEAAHELTRLHQRLQQHERTLWDLKARIAQRCRPEEIRLAQQQLEGEWTAYIPELLSRQDRDDQARAQTDPAAPAAPEGDLGG